MLRRFAFALGLVSTSITALLVACTVEQRAPDPLPVRDDEPDDPKPRADASTDRNTPDPPTDGGPRVPGRVFAHTDKKLYLFEPFEEKLTEIGAFSCLEANDRVLDIALDRTGAMFGTTDFRFISIDPTSAACTVVKDNVFDYPNSLSFVPAGTVDATKEALVGYAFGNTFNVADRYVRIDTATGEMTDVGNLNPQNAAVKYRSSGDLVSLIQDGNKTYLTVKQVGFEGGTPTDTLVEVDPATGTIKRVVGDTKQRDLFGFGYWAGKGYGFTFTGQILEVSTATAATTEITVLKTGDRGFVPWFGAGVTTQAPIAP